MSSATRIRLRWALLGAAAAALVMTAAALGGSGVGGIFNLGKTNTVNGTSALNGTTGGAQLSVLNSSKTSTGVGIAGRSSSATGAGVEGINLGGGPALQAVVSSNAVAPLKVNSNHVVPNLHAATSDALAGKLPASFWQLGGNAAGATGVLGTTNNQALDLRVNGARALRLEPNGSSPNIIGGAAGNGNPSGSGANGIVIAGGGDQFNTNQVTDDFSTVGGGFSNVAGDLDSNAISAQIATVGGGSQNHAGAIAATVSGGSTNTASPGQSSTVAGGSNNTASGTGSMDAGGVAGTASGDYSFVAGGANNTASGNYSFAGGRRAKATHDGSFVWGDSTNADVNDLGPNTFTVRASGGTYINGPEVVSGVLTSGLGFIPDGDTTPNVGAGNLFVTANTSPTTITDFPVGNAYLGQEITIIFGDGNTTVQHNSTILLKGAADFAAATNDTLTLVTVSGKWYEVSRSVNH